MALTPLEADHSDATTDTDTARLPAWRLTFAMMLCSILRTSGRSGSRSRSAVSTCCRLTSGSMFTTPIISVRSGTIAIRVYSVVYPA